MSARRSNITTLRYRRCVDVLWPWLAAFGFTQAVEIPVYLVALRVDRGEPDGAGARPVWESALVAFGASALTHPFVWFAFPALLPGVERYWRMVACAEAFAVIGEALYLWAFKVKRAFAWSLLANAMSFGTGLLSRAIFDWP